MDDDWQVPMICTQDNNKKLEEILAEYKIATTFEQRNLLLRHLDLVVDKNRVINLTRIVDEQEALVRHILDSLLFLKTINSFDLSSEARYVDVGTGAGFPGIPLGIMSEMKGVLIDSVGKKTSAVQEFIESLSLQDRIVARQIRAEDLARQERESFDLVVARAVADMGVLVEYASPLLSLGGCLVVSKGLISKEEINRGEKTARLTGMKNVSRETFELSLDMGHRELFVYQKASASKVGLPRKTGEAKYRPLVRD